jgi:hypothetical protein
MQNNLPAAAPVIATSTNNQYRVTIQLSMGNSSLSEISHSGKTMQLAHVYLRRGFLFLSV